MDNWNELKKFIESQQDKTYDVDRYETLEDVLDEMSRLKNECKESELKWD